jgi:hypothetical protein
VGDTGSVTSVPDPDLHGFALILVGWIRIQIQIRIDLIGWILNIVRNTMVGRDIVRDTLVGRDIVRNTVVGRAIVRNTVFGRDI